MTRNIKDCYRIINIVNTVSPCMVSSGPIKTKKIIRAISNVFAIGNNHIVMWEEGMNTKPQIYYSNKHASTPQASKRKKGKSDEDNMYNIVHLIIIVI